MKKIATFLQVHPNAKAAKPVEAAEIRDQESKLGLHFGSHYVSFLKKFGCLVVGPNEIYGICGMNNAVPSAIHATRSARRDKRFPKDLVVIAEDGRGKCFCLDSNDAVFTFERGTTERLDQSFEDFAIRWLSD